MNTPNTTAAAVLNDLVRINNDRIEGYERASQEAVDINLKSAFTAMIQESRRYVGRLSVEVARFGGSPVSGETTLAGRLYRVWMDVRSAFSGGDPTTILNSCDYGEEAAQQEYREALASRGLPGEVRDLIFKQQIALKESQGFIRRIRDEKAILDHSNQ